MKSFHLRPWMLERVGIFLKYSFKFIYLLGSCCTKCFFAIEQNFSRWPSNAPFQYTKLVSKAYIKKHTKKRGSWNHRTYLSTTKCNMWGSGMGKKYNKTQIGHIQLTHKYLMPWGTRPSCEHCVEDIIFTTKHIPTECPAFN